MKLQMGKVRKKTGNDKSKNTGYISNIFEDS